MMDFLRALAPSHAAGKTRAVPAVRSRFEESRPLSQVPAAHVEASAQDAGTGLPEMVGHHRAMTRSVEPARKDDTVRETLAERIAVAPADSRVTMPPVPEQARSALQPQHVRAAAATSESAEPAERARAMPRASAPPALLRGAQPMRAALRAPAAASIGMTSWEVAGSPPGPLSSSAVAARAESRPDTRPIIHVTIDRIDVRAPSVPERPSSRPRSRPTTSASLSDYLRSRRTSGSGGAS